jgi:valyl-tRNA synthetase
MPYSSMDKTYQPEQIEQKLYQTWEAAGVFKNKGTGKKFCIMLPPPNVTGSLHMGHAFQQTLMDILIRYHHMLGDKTHWQVGLDHAGIATQMVVENQLKLEHKTRYDLGRDAFIERIWAWKKQSGGQITQQMRRLGLAIDWHHEHFTMDETLSTAVKTAFIKLADEKLIYRKKRLVNWDPNLKTAVSDLEVIPTEEQGSLWHIRYPLSDGRMSLIVATTRPETMFGDAAVAVHPEDARYQQLIGKHIKLPLTDREIPIIADTFVAMDFGSGCVKVTPAHDFTDYEVGLRHELPLINIFTEEARLNQSVPEAYQGLDRFEARKKVLAELTQQDLLVKTDAHTLKIPRNDRGNAVLEPYLMDQWYVDVKAMAHAAQNAAHQQKFTFIPENWINTYNEWLENIQDWCISRQLWWGHRIPAWYDAAQNYYVGVDELDVRKKYKIPATTPLTQDEDVLDTWFSSALWPFSTLGWPDQATPMYQEFYPTSVLITGFDIIFFWVARMVMFGLKFTGQVPFEKVYITGLIRDHEGQKMSKSKGNVLDPIDLIDGIGLTDLIHKRTSGMMQERLKEKAIKATEKQFPEGISPHGTDALRFTFTALASHSRDINFDNKRLEGYRNFCNKLWNAARFVLMNLGETALAPPKTIMHPINQWMLATLYTTIETTAQNFQHYRFDLLAQELHRSVWNDFCDWYLEFAKVLLNSHETAHETRYVITQTLETYLRLLHPIIPFITETIWQSVKVKLNLSEQFIIERPYPITKEFKKAAGQGVEIKKLISIISQMRIFRSENQVNPSKIINVLTPAANKAWDFHKQYLDIINQLARVNLEQLEHHTNLPANIRLDVEGHVYFILLSDFIDKELELKRTEKELHEILANIDSITNKLNNSSFVDKAPAQVVAKERARLAEQKNLQEKLLSKIAELKKL